MVKSQIASFLQSDIKSIVCLKHCSLSTNIHTVYWVHIFGKIKEIRNTVRIISLKNKLQDKLEIISVSWFELAINNLSDLSDINVFFDELLQFKFHRLDDHIQLEYLYVNILLLFFCIWHNCLSRKKGYSNIFVLSQMPSQEKRSDPTGCRKHFFSHLLMPISSTLWKTRMHAYYFFFSVYNLKFRCHAKSLIHSRSVFNFVFIVWTIQYKIWRLFIQCIGGSTGGARDGPITPHPLSVHFFHFHAVFGKKWSNPCFLCPPLVLASPMEILDPLVHFIFVP